MAHLARLKLLKVFLEQLPEENFRWASVNCPSQDEPICNTKACIAGWSHYLFGPDDNHWSDDMPELKITKAEANFLCYAYEWREFSSLPKFGPISEAIHRVGALIKYYEQGCPPYEPSKELDI